MNKKLIAVAVAGMFAAPAAFAQSTVTISGKLMVSYGGYKLNNRAAGGIGRSSEDMVKDESSRIVFLVREDLGGGLAAIGKFDLRPSVPDNGATGNTGESYVGLTSPTWGTIGMGRYDLHYGNHGSFTGTHAGLMTNPTAVFDVGLAGGLAYANQTRTNNVIRYGSPKWGDMFEVVVAYSSQPSAASTTPGLSGVVGQPASQVSFNTQNESDIRSTLRKGNAWNMAPRLWGKNWEVGYSYWLQRPDLALNAPSATGTNGGVGTGAILGATNVLKMRGDALYGWYQWGGLRAGLAWNKSKADLTNITGAAFTPTGQAVALAAGATARITNRSVWGIPISYNWGNHTVYGDFYRARRDTGMTIAGLDTKANFVGLTYAYDMSKRTTVALSYSKITNGANAGYNLFTAATPGGSGTVNPQGVAAGEDPRFMAVTLQHRY